MKKAEITKKNNIFIVCAFLIGIFNDINLPGSWGLEKGALVAFGYLALAIWWGLSAMERIQEKQSRRILLWIIIFLCFWIIIRGIKYEITIHGMVGVYLWYLYYLPQTILPLLVFFMTLHIDESRKHSKTIWLLVPAGLLILGVLTNNYHFLAFDFGENPIEDGGSYSHGLLFYACWVWMISFLMAAVINAARKSKLLHLRKALTGIILWLIFAVGYSVYFVYGPIFARVRLFNFPEANCLFYIIFLEICIQNGLLLSSSNHAEIFEAASLMAEITDEEGQTYMKTGLCPEITEETKRNCLNTSLIIDDTYEARVNNLKDGRIYWLNDISDLLEVNRKLEDMGDQIAEENTILEAEIQAKEQKAALEEQNRIYNEVNLAIREKSDKMFHLLEQPDNLQKALILAAYMKRKGNLVILSRQQDDADIRELGLCINESFSYLRLTGVICNCTISGEGTLPVNAMADLYDVFEEILETYYAGMEAFLCYVKVTEESVNVRCQLECTEEPSELDGRIRQLAEERQLNPTAEVQDNTLYITLFVREVSL